METSHAIEFRPRSFGHRPRTSMPLLSYVPDASDAAPQQQHRVGAVSESTTSSNHSMRELSGQSLSTDDTANTAARPPAINDTNQQVIHAAVASSTAATTTKDDLTSRRAATSSMRRPGTATATLGTATSLDSVLVSQHATSDPHLDLGGSIGQSAPNIARVSGTAAPQSTTQGGASPPKKDTQECVDYLSYDFDTFDLHQCWRNATRSRNFMQNGRRLENASWRRFFQLKFGLKTVDPSTLNWEKDSDVCWLYGPFHAYQPLAVLQAKYAEASAQPSQSQAAVSASLKSALKKRTQKEFLTGLMRDIYPPASTSATSSTSSTQAGGNNTPRVTIINRNNTPDMVSESAATGFSSATGAVRPKLYHTVSVDHSETPSHKKKSKGLLADFVDAVTDGDNDDSDNDCDNSVVSDDEAVLLHGDMNNDASIATASTTFDDGVLDNTHQRRSASTGNRPIQRLSVGFSQDGVLDVRNAFTERGNDPLADTAPSQGRARRSAEVTSDALSKHARFFLTDAVDDSQLDSFGLGSQVGGNVTGGGAETINEKEMVKVLGGMPSPRSTISASTTPPHGAKMPKFTESDSENERRFPKKLTSLEDENGAHADTEFDDRAGRDGMFGYESEDSDDNNEQLGFIAEDPLWLPNRDVSDSFFDVDVTRGFAVRGKKGAVPSQVIRPHSFVGLPTARNPLTSTINNESLGTVRDPDSTGAVDVNSPDFEPPVIKRAKSLDRGLHAFMVLSSLEKNPDNEHSNHHNLQQQPQQQQQPQHQHQSQQTYRQDTSVIPPTASTGMDQKDGQNRLSTGIAYNSDSSSITGGATSASSVDFGGACFGLSKLPAKQPQQSQQQQPDESIKVSNSVAEMCILRGDPVQMVSKSTTPYQQQQLAKKQQQEQQQTTQQQPKQDLQRSVTDGKAQTTISQNNNSVSNSSSQPGSVQLLYDEYDDSPLTWREVASVIGRGVWLGVKSLWKSDLQA